MNLRTNSFVILMLAFCMSCCVFCDCPISSLSRQSFSGTIVANLKTQQNSLDKTYIYNYPLSQEIRDINKIKIAIAINGFNIEKINDQFGLKIESMGVIQDSGTLGFRVVLGKTQDKEKWKEISFNFLLSDIEQIIVGYKEVSTIVANSNLNQYQISETLVPLNVQYFRATVKIFLSGFSILQNVPKQDPKKPKIDPKRLKALSYFNSDYMDILYQLPPSIGNTKTPRLTIEEPYLTWNGILCFRISTNLFKIKAFYYSYVVYLEKSNKDIVYPGISREFIVNGGASKTEFIKGLNNGIGRIFGMSGFSLGQDKNNFNFEIKNGRKQGKQYITSSHADNHQQFIIQYFGFQSLPAAICKPCVGSPLIFKQFCVSQCPPGFISSLNTYGAFQCQQCSIQKFLIPNQQRRSCRCSDSYYLSPTSLSCQKCPYDCLTCNSTHCITCGTNRLLNETTGRCQCQLMNSQGISFYENRAQEERRCALCHFKCKTCKGPSISDCVTCAARKIIDNGYCKCTDNFVEDQKGQCMCYAPNSITAEGLCHTKQAVCSQTQILVITNDVPTCICKTGYILSPSSNQCIKECTNSQQLNPITQKCECKQGYLKNPSTNLCYACQSKLHQYYNSQIKKCACIEGYQMNKQNQCILCASKMYYNIQSDQCQCIFNFYRNGNQCVKCVDDETDGCQKVSSTRSQS